MNIIDIFETEPEFINELGVKWWRDIETTRYAQSPDKNGINLQVICFFIEEPNGRKTRVLVNKDREIIEETQKLEEMGTKIDVRKFLKYEEMKKGNINE